MSIFFIKLQISLSIVLSWHLYIRGVALLVRTKAKNFELTAPPLLFVDKTVIIYSVDQLLKLSLSTISISPPQYFGPVTLSFTADSSFLAVVTALILLPVVSGTRLELFEWSMETFCKKSLTVSTALESSWGVALFFSCGENSFSTIRTLQTKRNKNIKFLSDEKME